MKRFYVGLLGFAVEWEPDADHVYLTSGLDNLALHRAARPPATPSVLDHFGLVVREADDVDRWAAYLAQQGVALTARPRTHRDGARSCYFKDPDGKTVQIIHHPPIAGKA